MSKEHFDEYEQMLEYRRQGYEKEEAMDMAERDRKKFERERENKILHKDEKTRESNSGCATILVIPLIISITLLSIVL